VDLELRRLLHRVGLNPGRGEFKVDRAYYVDEALRFLDDASIYYMLGKVGDAHQALRIAKDDAHTATRFESEVGKALLEDIKSVRDMIERKEDPGKVDEEVSRIRWKRLKEKLDEYCGK